jgi:hypothetical protein
MDGVDNRLDVVDYPCVDQMGTLGAHRRLELLVVWPVSCKLG